MTLRQLVDWLEQTHHVPVKGLQYEGYNDPPLYDEKEARNEQKMNMVLKTAFCWGALIPK